jgi:hypothetical protein
VPRCGALAERCGRGAFVGLSRMLWSKAVADAGVRVGGGTEWGVWGGGSSAVRESLDRLTGVVSPGSRAEAALRSVRDRPSRDRPGR